MSEAFHYIEAKIRYLPPGEGGRTTGVSSGYRGQFHYEGDDYDGFQLFPDCPNEIIRLGSTVRALVQFRRDQWNEVHSNRIEVGMPFEIREGARIVGHGTITRVDVDESGLEVE